MPPWYQPLITAVLITRIRCMFTTGFVVAQFFQTSHTSKYSSVTLHLKDRHKLHPNYFLKRKVDRLVSPLYVLCVKHALFEFRADKSQASRKHANFTWYPPGVVCYFAYCFYITKYIPSILYVMSMT